MHTPYERRSLDFQGGDCRGGTSRLACAAHLHYHLELVYMEQGENVLQQSHRRAAAFAEGFPGLAAFNEELASQIGA